MKDSVVKSAGRVFEVLELFNTERKALTATAIARSLKYPASSAVALLKSLVNLGYLSYDPAERTYFPTIQLALISHWLEDSFYAEGHLLELMDEISKATGESIFLCWQNDLQLQVIQAKAPTKGECLADIGPRIGLFESVAGLTALTLKRDLEIAQLAERVNASGKTTGRVNLPTAMEHIRTFRNQGYGVGYDFLKPGVSTLAWPLRHKGSNRTLVLSVLGPTERIKSETRNIVEVAKSAISSHHL